MEPEGSSQHSQAPATYRYPEPDQSIPCPPSHFFKIHSNINPPSKTRSSNWSLSLRCPHHNPVCTWPFTSTCHMPYQSHLHWFDHSNNIWWAIQITKLLIKQLSVTSTLWWRANNVAQKRNTVRKYQWWLLKVYEQMYSSSLALASDSFRSRDAQLGIRDVMPAWKFNAYESPVLVCCVV